MKKRSKFSHKIEYFFLFILYIIVNSTPYRFTHLLASMMSSFSFSVLRIRRKETVKRVMQALDVPRKEAVSIAKASYYNLVAAALEFIRFKKLRRIFDKGYITVEHLDIAEKLKEEESGAVFVAMHSGSWEVSGAALRFLGFPMFYIVGIQHNPYVDDLMNRMRRAIGVEIIPKKGTLKHVFRRLKKGEFLGLIADQRVIGDSILVDFFGRTVSIPKGPAAFARKTGVPVVPFITLREKGGHHRVLLKSPIFPDEKLNKADDIKRITQEYTRVFEQVIREHPGDWFWLHRRWKKEGDSE